MHSITIIDAAPRAQSLAFLDNIITGSVPGGREEEEVVAKVIGVLRGGGQVTLHQSVELHAVQILETFLSLQPQSIYTIRASPLRFSVLLMKFQLSFRCQLKNINYKIMLPVLQSARS